MPRARPAGVLVVDDDRVMRHLTRSVLQKAGFRVRVAKDGVEATKQLRAGKFDLMLLDLWMPRMNGLAVLDRLTRFKRAPKVIMLTSDDAPETLLSVMKKRAHQFVHKPIDPTELVSLVTNAINAGPQPPIDVVSARPDWVELSVPAPATPPIVSTGSWRTWTPTCRKRCANRSATRSASCC